jgi:hypothetical protein
LFPTCVSRHLSVGRYLCSLLFLSQVFDTPPAPYTFPGPPICVASLVGASSSGSGSGATPTSSATAPASSSKPKGKSYKSKRVYHGFQARGGRTAAAYKPYHARAGAFFGWQRKPHTDRPPSLVFIHACGDSSRLASWDLYWHHSWAEDWTVCYLTYVRIISCWCITISPGYCGCVLRTDTT